MCALIVLGLACASTPAGAADGGRGDDKAKDAGLEKQECIDRELAKGHDETASHAICKVKRLFQSRIRTKPDTDPIEMTVGSPPMISDDTDTPGPGNWEFNLVFTGERSSQRRDFEAPLVDINYGIGERLQLKYEVPYVVSHDSAAEGAQRSDHGVGDSIVGLKYRYFDNEDTGVSLAVYPQVRFRTPSANRAVSEGGTSIILPFLLTSEFTNASITANVGVEKSSAADRAAYFASVGVGTRLNDTTALLAEIAAEDLQDSSERRTLFNVGVKLKLSEHRSILASIGHDLSRPDGMSPNTYVTIAYQWLYGE